MKNKMNVNLGIVIDVEDESNSRVWAEGSRASILSGLYVLIAEICSRADISVTEMLNDLHEADSLFHQPEKASTLFEMALKNGDVQ